MLDLYPLAKQSYISLETYRKNGTPVCTPVWFAQDESSPEIYVTTEATSGKVKRIRNNPSVKLAPSNGSGTPKQEYQAATARIAEDGSAEFIKGANLINKKYGLIKKLFDLISRNKNPHVIIILK